jgi:transaldolase
MIESPVERLAKTHPDLEIWWDSSPLVYRQWAHKMVKAAGGERHALMKEQLSRLYNEAHPEESVFRGCTTNPPLSWQVIQSDPDTWSGVVDEFLTGYPDLSLHEIAWLTYKEIVRRGAQMYLPIYQASGGRFGWISGQLDPRLFTETERMLSDARELSDLSPNVMIKVPASMQGIEVVRMLTSKGISTNTTVCFTLPQIMASAEAAMQGIRLAEKQGTDLSRWRAVITMMIGRLTENKVIDLQAERRNLRLSWQDKHWFGIAVFRRAYRMLQEGGYASKMLACSLREGPLVAGKRRFWDVELLAGGEIVYTCPPYVLEPLFEIGDQLSFKREIDNRVPEEVLDKLLKIPYCIQAYDPNGLELEQFNDHPATIETVQTFSKGFSSLEDFVNQRKTVLSRQSVLQKHQ